MNDSKSLLVVVARCKRSESGEGCVRATLEASEVGKGHCDDCVHDKKKRRVPRHTNEKKHKIGEDRVRGPVQPFQRREQSQRRARVRTKEGQKTIAMRRVTGLVDLPCSPCQVWLGR